MIKTRIAPSPTGNLHVGTARTALFNYLFARHHNGEFLLRIEDTDIKRSEKRYEEEIIEGLTWLGISWDGHIVRQTERLDSHEKYVKQLLKEGKAFYCFHTEEELENDRKNQMEHKMVIRHFCASWRDVPFKEAEKKRKAGENSIIRFKIPRTPENHQIVFDDIIRGQVRFFTGPLGDFPIAKDFRVPLYNFAVVIDDFEMEISHVIRGEDHIPNTPKQLLIAEALGFISKDNGGVFRPPWEYAHLPLILGPDRSKLSKRHGATSIQEYRDDGYLADALFNFLALLGWNPGTEKEIFSRAELIELFSLDRVQKSGAIFDVTKLNWMNNQYIGKKLPEELRMLAIPYIGNFLQNQKLKIKDQNEYIEQILALEQSRITKLSELPEQVEYFFKQPTYEKELLRWKSMSDEELKNALAAAKKTIENIPEEHWNKEYIESAFLKEAATYTNRGELLWPLRVALSGKKASPGPFEIMAILGKQTTLRHIQHALDLLVL
ncbi:glutamate--tRNA ligase [Candidatus Giovannonibacteria bacterium RIFCSPHIGHO2_02_FULL_46_20]|uniref:Glutamate--tRNA ligase n=1 Tax=Candidatus Giovannonibacteria bacterium RIFCSPHIGHO2_02_FULL_46_20 TaxID=1798338 RepID=A0A1F5WE70_9BACT|nr:MAG: glutamate--tRNA ligase [Candidatus Giovannonibacteria bacterium RIFCSPHIGHO2_02_FULL_46_20]